MPSGRIRSRASPARPICGRTPALSRRAGLQPMPTEGLSTDREPARTRLPGTAPPARPRGEPLAPFGRRLDRHLQLTALQEQVEQPGGSPSSGRIGHSRSWISMGCPSWRLLTPSPGALAEARSDRSPERRGCRTRAAVPDYKLAGERSSPVRLNARRVTDARPRGSSGGRRHREARRSGRSRRDGSGIQRAPGGHPQGGRRGPGRTGGAAGGRQRHRGRARRTFPRRERSSDQGRQGLPSFGLKLSRGDVRRPEFCPNSASATNEAKSAVASRARPIIARAGRGRVRKGAEGGTSGMPASWHCYVLGYAAFPKAMWAGWMGYLAERRIGDVRSPPVKNVGRLQPVPLRSTVVRGLRGGGRGRGRGLIPAAARTTAPPVRPCRPGPRPATPRTARCVGGRCCDGRREPPPYGPNCRAGRASSAGCRPAAG